MLTINSRSCTDEELKKEIEKKERMLADYQEIAKLIKPSDDEYQKQIDNLLDDLIELRKRISN